MNEVPEAAGTRPECGRANGPPRRNLDWDPGSVCVLSSAVRKILSGNARRSACDSGSGSLTPKSTDGDGPVSGAKAERERSEREVRGGGWERWERVAATGGDRREPVKRDCGAGRGGAVGGEASPSTGWRETAEQMAASEGCSHR